MDQLTAFSRSEVNNSNEWEGSGGNPKLKPYRANAFDISYEKYFGTKGYVSVAAFHKIFLELDSSHSDGVRLHWVPKRFDSRSGQQPRRVHAAREPQGWQAQRH